MGEYKTQSRKLSYLPSVLASIDGGSASRLYPYLFEAGGAASQTTESYRTSRSTHTTVSEQELRAEAALTYNALKRASPRYDSGHPFYTTKTWFRASHPDWKIYARDTRNKVHRRRGPLYPINNSGFTGGEDKGYYPSEVRLTSTEISQYGGRALRSVNPVRSSADLTTFLGELLEAVPSMIGLSLLREGTDNFRSYGSEYLNVQFGWAPFVSDIRNIMEAVRSSHKIARQYVRDSGRSVRRRFSFPVETSGTVTTVTRPGAKLFGYTDSDPQWFDPDWVFSPTLLENNRRRSLWFSGAFTYYLDPGNGVLDRLERHAALADRVLGISLTPDVLWELAPWSWLVDWWADIGMLLTNASLFATDGLVMRYGYLMCHTYEFNRFLISSGAKFKTSGFKTGPIYTLWGRETKQRVRATPYGFGINLNGLSPFQWSILGALGLTKAPGTLFGL